MPIRQPAIVSYTERFVAALATLCDESPPLELCRAWLNSDDEELQVWVLRRMRNDWATGIGTIDAARLLAGETEEGRPELVSLGVERVIDHLQHSDIPVVLRKTKGWVAKACPPGLTQDAIQDVLSGSLGVIHDVTRNGAMLRLSNEYTFA